MTKIINKAYKFSLNPKDESIDFLNQCFGHTRFVFNYFLNYRSESYKNHQLKVNYQDTSKLLTQLKKQEDYQWLKDIPSIPLQQKLRHLDTAFKNFFKKQAKYPRLKKRESRQSASFLTSGNTYVGDGYVVISQHKKQFKIPFIKHRNFDFTKVKSFNISKESNGKYFISCSIEEEIKPISKPKNVIKAVDLGLKDYLIDDENNKTLPLKALNNNLKTLRKLNQSLSRKKKNSNNFKKAKIKLSTLHCLIANQRKDFLHKLSSKLINENQVICLETLKVKNMIKNKRLSRHIADASWGMFVEFLTYKAQWYDRELVKIDTYVPSSKLCNKCKTKNEDLKLSDRKWICKTCHTIHDRDHNAAINIKEESLNMIATDKDFKEIIDDEGLLNIEKSQ